MRLVGRLRSALPTPVLIYTRIIFIFYSIATSLSMSGTTLLFELYTSNNTCEEVGPKGAAPTSKSDGECLHTFYTPVRQLLVVWDPDSDIGYELSAATGSAVLHCRSNH